MTSAKQPAPATSPRTSHPALACLLGLIAIAIFVSPYLLLGQDSHILIHDQLDCAPIQHHLHFHQSNPLWRSGTPDPAFMNGSIPACPGPVLHGAWWPYYFLPPFIAFVLNQILARLIAFTGMFLLARQLFATQRHGQAVATAIAILFAALKFYLPTPFAVPVLPWLCWSWLAIWHEEDHARHWLVLLIVPFLSFFLTAPLFLLILAGCLWLLAALRGRWHPRLFLALALTAGLYLIANYELILRAADGDYVSQRTQWKPLATHGLDLTGSILKSGANFVLGHYHVATHHTALLVLLLPTAAVAATTWLRRRNTASQRASEPATTKTPWHADPTRMLPLLVALSGVFALIYGFWYWTPLYHWRLTVPLLGMLNLSRFYWLYPLLWYLALGYALLYCLRGAAFANRPRRAHALLLVICFGQFAWLFIQSDYLTARRQHLPTYRQFFATAQFARLHNLINEPPDAYRVASLGLYPSVALYNGFYCLDGYRSDHSLAYHERFRRIIAPELALSADLRQNFDNWGGRCYLFSSELGRDYLCTADRAVEIDSLRINRAAFRDMGGRYIISAVHIRNAESSGLQLLATDHANPNESAWTIHLYKVLPPKHPPPSQGGARGG